MRTHGRAIELMHGIVRCANRVPASIGSRLAQFKGLITAAVPLEQFGTQRIARKRPLAQIPACAQVFVLQRTIFVEEVAVGWIAFAGIVVVVAAGDILDTGGRIAAKEGAL